jgi:hypothetical protein
MLFWIAQSLVIVTSICNLTPSGVNDCDGVFVTSKEGTCYQYEVIELSRGKFRYWFYFDVPQTRPYPIEGEYQIDGQYLRLKHMELEHKFFKFELLGTTPVLVDQSVEILGPLAAKEMAAKLPTFVLIKMHESRVADVKTLGTRCVSEIYPSVQFEKPCKSCDSPY